MTLGPGLVDEGMGKNTNSVIAFCNGPMGHACLVESEPAY